MNSINLSPIRVEPEGPTNPIMILVGEAPGAEEEITGTPFVGPSGRLLNQKLGMANIPRTECYITNLVKNRPAKNNFGVFWKGESPKPELIQHRDELLKELDTINTNVIVALGTNALWALTGETQIGKWRGSPLQTTLPSGKVVKVIPTYHPAAVLRVWSLGTILQLDLTKAKKESETKEYNLVKRTFIIDPTISDIESYLQACIKSKEFAFDIETSPRGIECISFSYSKESALCIPTILKYWVDKEIKDELSYYNTKNKDPQIIFKDKEVMRKNATALGLANLKYIHSLMYEVFNSNAIKIAQNIGFELQYISRFWGYLIKKPWFDTMIAQHSCYPEFLKGLDFLTSVYINEPYYKDDLRTWKENISDLKLLWTYNCKDSAYTLEIKHALVNEMKDLTVTHTYNHMMDLVEPLVFMMLKGLAPDKDRIKHYKKVYQDQLDTVMEEIQEKFGDVNPNSSQQMLALIKKLKIKPVMRGKRPTADEKAIRKYTMQNKDLGLFVEARKLNKIISTYLNVTLDGIDGRLKYSFRSTGTVTGRLSSTQSAFWCGLNIQNVPKKIRDIVIPDPGKIFTEADLKGADAMIVAYLSCDPILIALFDQGKNVHNYTADLIWGISDEELAEDKKICAEKGIKSKYALAKIVRHAGNYLETWKGLGDQLLILPKEAKDLLRRFYESSPSLLSWHEEVKQQIQLNRTLISPLDRKRVFYDRISDELIRKAVAHVPQGTVGDVLNLGIINIYNTLCKEYKEIDILLQVHDSVLLQHPPELSEMIHKELHKLMKIDLVIKGQEFFIPIEISTGYNWKDLKVIN